MGAKEDREWRKEALFRFAGKIPDINRRINAALREGKPRLPDAQNHYRYSPRHCLWCQRSYDTLRGLELHVMNNHMGRENV